MVLKGWYAQRPNHSSSGGIIGNLILSIATVGKIWNSYSLYTDTNFSPFFCSIWCMQAHSTMFDYMENFSHYHEIIQQFHLLLTGGKS